MHSLSFNLKTKYYGHVDKLIYSSLLPLGLLRNLGPASLDLNSSSPKTWIWCDKTGWWQWNKSVQTKHWHFKFVVQAKTCSKNWILSKKKKNHSLSSHFQNWESWVSKNWIFLYSFSLFASSAKEVVVSDCDIQYAENGLKKNFGKKKIHSTKYDWLLRIS